MGLAEALIQEGPTQTSAEEVPSHFRLAAEEVWKASQEGNKEAFLEALEAGVDIKKAEK